MYVDGVAEDVVVDSVDVVLDSVVVFAILDAFEEIVDEKVALELENSCDLDLVASARLDRTPLLSCVTDEDSLNCRFLSEVELLCTGVSTVLKFSLSEIRSTSRLLSVKFTWLLRAAMKYDTVAFWSHVTISVVSRLCNLTGVPGSEEAGNTTGHSCQLCSLLFQYTSNPRDVKPDLSKFMAFEMPS